MDSWRAMTPNGPPRPSTVTSRGQAAPVLAGRDAEAAPEVAVQVALVGEAGGGVGGVGTAGGLGEGGDRLARLERPPRRTHPMGHLERVGRKPGPLAEEA